MCHKEASKEYGKIYSITVRVSYGLHSKCIHMYMYMYVCMYMYVPRWHAVYDSINFFDSETNKGNKHR